TAEVLRYVVELEERCGELAGVVATEAVLARIDASDDLSQCRALKAAITLGAYDDAWAIAGRAATTSPSASMLLLRARLALHRGELDAAERLTREASTHPNAAATRGELFHMRGLVDFYRGRIKDAERRLRRASRLVEPKADPVGAASIATSRGLAAHKSGKLSRALLHYRRAYRLSRAAGDVTRLPARLLNLGTAAQDAGRLAAAHAHYQEAATLAARVGSDRDRVRVGFNIANLAIQIGALDSAARWLKLTTPLAAERGMRVEVARLHLLDAEIGIANESFDHARAALARFAEFRGERDGQMARHAALVHAKLALLEGDVLHARLAVSDLDLTDAEAALVAARIEACDRGAPPGRAVELATRAMRGSPLLDWQVALVQAELAERAGDDLGLDDAVAVARVNFRRALAALPREHIGDYQRVPANAREVARLSSLWAKARGSGASSLLERVLRINRKLNECADLDELLGAILDEVSALTASERSLALVKREGGMAVLAQRAIANGSDTDFSRGIAEQVIASGRSIVTSDAMADERFMEQRSVRDLRMRSIACVPLLIDGAPRGAIYLDHRARADVFSVDALSVLTAFAEQAALALKSAELRLALLDERRQLEVARSNLANENEALHSSLSRTSEELARTKLHLAAGSDDDGLRAKFSQIVARSRGMLDVLDKVQRFASVPLPIFVHGESGAGKELVARALHTHSPRVEGPFVALNCAAIPNELLESELFGVRRGAFTGALNDREGLFRVADGGTLFLDEVGDMGSPMQTKLLRVLEEGTFRAVGATDEQQTDVRIVCASHRSLSALVAAGRFREDLYYRLAGALIEIPPLRDRADDIPELVRVLLIRAAKEFGIAVPKVKRDVLDALQSYAWPGNVRELDNELRRALALADDELRVGHFSKSVRAALRGLSMSAAKSKRYRDAVATFEKSFLAEALAANDNDPSRAARAIGISRSGIYAKLKQHRLVNDA
ncbi:MAG TPA: sigma 54-interacting transcriptional regulator, partial [Myxococcota bacterium]|nr:sigma 54-interacting transcriptional regulator [Myxococcota bacterium]